MSKGPDFTPDPQWNDDCRTENVQVILKQGKNQDAFAFSVAVLVIVIGSIGCDP